MLQMPWNIRIMANVADNRDDLSIVIELHHFNVAMNIARNRYYARIMKKTDFHCMFKTLLHCDKGK